MVKKLNKNILTDKPQMFAFGIKTAYPFWRTIEYMVLDTPVTFTNDQVENEYLRWVNELGDEDPYYTERTIGIHEVLRAHFLIADYFYSQGYGIGGIGPKEPDMLHSAVYRQFISYDGKDKWKNDYERAATLAFGIICNHPFHDANKRTGLLVLLLFLRKLRRVPTVNHKKLENLAVEIADHKLSKYRRFNTLKKKSHDPETLFIADFLKRNSRVPDSRFRTLTFNQLDTRLRDLGYRLDNPHQNYIDVVRTEERRKLFGFGKKEAIDVKVTQIGFPGWTKQVTPSAISKLRREAKLKIEDGVDSGTFYEGLDPIPPLIAEYAGPLERLADR
jgi:death-on-curing protein